MSSSLIFPTKVVITRSINTDSSIFMCMLPERQPSWIRKYLNPRKISENLYSVAIIMRDQITDIGICMF